MNFLSESEQITGEPWTLLPTCEARGHQRTSRYLEPGTRSSEPLEPWSVIPRWPLLAIKSVWYIDHELNFKSIRLIYHWRNVGRAAGCRPGTGASRQSVIENGGTQWAVSTRDWSEPRGLRNIFRTLKIFAVLPKYFQWHIWTVCDWTCPETRASESSVEEWRLARMAFMRSCLCCSLLTGSIMIGIVSAFLYGVAFAVELWMILETDVSLSVPAYILTIGYLLMALLSLCLLVSLR